MRIGIVVNGSRGDIQPYVALGAALKAAGHTVTVTANADAAPLVAAAELGFVPMDLDTRAWLSSPEGQAAIAEGTARALLDSANRWLSGALDTIRDSTVAVAEDSDALIAGAQMDDYVLPIAEVYGRPLLFAYLTPWIPTSEFPQVLLSQARVRPRPLAAAFNHRTYRQLERLYWRGKRDAVAALRRQLKRRPASGSVLWLNHRVKVTSLHAFSTTVVPRPRDWGPHNVVTGYWRLQAEVRRRLGEADPPAGLVDWLGAGPPPVFLSFGSLPQDPARLMDLATQAARRTGQRLLIGAGWTELATVADDQVYTVDAVDHEWLFPRCRAVVHHGGAGTTAAGLTAGRPTWIFALWMDEPYWGSRVTRLGVGGASRFAGSGPDELCTVLERLADAEVRRRAEALGARLRAEDGLSRAVEVVHRRVAAAAGRR